MKKVISTLLVFALLLASFLSIAPLLTIKKVKAADVIGDNLTDSRVQDFSFAGSSLVINNLSVSAHNPFVAVYVVWRENGESITDVSVGPITLNIADATIIQSSSSPAIHTSAYYFYSPTDGIHDVTVNFSGNTDEVAVSIISLANVFNASTIFGIDFIDAQDHFSTSVFVDNNQALLGVVGIDGLPSLSPNGNTQILGETSAPTTKATLFASAEDGFGNLEVTYDGYYNYNYIFELIEFQQPSPFVTVTNEPIGDIENTNFIYFEGNVEDFNGFNITEITYSLDGGFVTNVDAFDGFFDETIEEFYIDLGLLANGNHYLEINASNDNFENAPTKTINFTVNNLSAQPDCELSNHSSPTTDTTPSYVAVCASVDGLYNAEYRVYDFNTGILQDWTSLNPDLGSFGDTNLTFSFTVPFALADGNIEIKFRIQTGTGQSYSDGYEPIDTIVVETSDNNIPLVIANPILPNPTVDDTPTVVGYCQDNHPFDTNSTIMLIYYQLDGGGWNEMLPTDGIYDEYKENFEIPLGPLPTGGPYTVDVRCVDSAGNDTNAGAANDSVTFSIIPPSSVPAEELVELEEFDDDLANALSESNVVWGNGYIRLRETLTHTQTAVDTTSFGSRYGLIFGSEYKTTKGENGLLYYAKDSTIHSYNPNTFQIVNYDVTGAAPSIEQISEIGAFSSGGDDYVVLTSSAGLLIFNTDLSSGYLYNANGLDVGLYGPDQVKVDRRSGRTGLLVRNSSANGGNTSNVFYLDLGVDIMNTADDTYLWLENGNGINLNNVTEVMIDEQTNGIYLTAFGDGLVRLDDNNTPTDTGDDSRFIHVTGAGVDLSLVVNMAKDTQTGAVYLVQTDTESRLLALNLNGTPDNSADDTFTILADGSDLQRQSITEMEFLEGPAYIGGQLFLGTNQGQVLYVNTNGTAYQTSDDTIIELDASMGVYPVSISGLIVDDYNNLYVNLNRLGFYRLELDRGWETNNTAITVPFVPEDRVIVNNITLETSNVGPRVQTSGSQLDNGAGNGILYYVSVDDGINWTPITIQETVFVPEEDYRFRFRIDLSELVGEQTPVVDDFTLTYGTYQDDAQIEQPDLQLDVFPLTVEQDEHFTLSVTAIDPLGYPIPSYNGTVNLQLRNDGTLHPAPYFNYTQVNLVNGVAVLNDASINTSGDYFVEGSAPGPIDDNSPVITVTELPPAGDDGGGSSGGGHDNGGEDDGGADDGGGTTDEGGDDSSEQTDNNGGGDSGSEDVDDGLNQGSSQVGVEVGSIGFIDDIDQISDTESEIDVSFYNLGQLIQKSLPDTRDIEVSAPIELQPQVLSATQTATLELLAPVALATAIAASSALIYRTVGYIGIFLGGIVWRRKKYWGFIMDAKNRNPLGLVTIRVYKLENGQSLFVTQTISDLDGSYGINIAEKGQYLVEFRREGYIQVTREVKVNPEQDIVFDVLMKKEDQPNLPFLSQIHAFMYEHPHIILHVLRAIVIVVTILGMKNAIAVTEMNPSTQNMIITCLHVLVLTASAFLWILPTLNTTSGKILDESNNPVQGAVVRLYYLDNFNKMAAMGLSNEAGIVKVKVKSGMYKIVATGWQYVEQQMVSKVNKGGKLMKTITLKKSLEKSHEGFLS